MLYLDKLPVWAVVLISVAAGLIVAIGVQLLLVPRLRRQIKGECCTVLGRLGVGRGAAGVW